MSTVFIAGASSGIGRELALSYASKGYQVIACARRIELLESLKASHPTLISIFRMDIANIKETSDTLKTIRQSFPEIDLFLISSGTGDINHELDIDIELKTVDTNVRGFTFLADWAFNLFTAKGKGHLVGISSVAGIRGSRFAPAYNASKAYQINYLEGLKQKARHLKLPIYVTDIRPGFIDTDMAKGEGLFWVSPVEKAGSQIVKDIKNKRSTAYVSRRWRAVAAVLSAIPEFLYLLM